MVNIKEANEDIKRIATRNNVAVFSTTDLFNDKINNHFHYDYQKVIDEVSRLNGRDMTQELINSGYLLPLPNGEYEINLQYDINTIGQKDKKVSLISAPDNDLMTSYREAAYILQDEYNLFPDDTLQYKYNDAIFLDIERQEYKSFLRDQHAKCFSYAAMMLRSDNPQEFAQNALRAWKEGLSDTNSDLNNLSKASFPVMAAILKRCLEICNSGKSKEFFTPDGRLDDQKLSLLCQDIVYQNAYSPQKFQSSLGKDLHNQNNQSDLVYEQAQQKLLKYLAVLTPEADEYWDVKEMQKQLYNNNKAVIEKVMGMSYGQFLSSRNKIDSMKKMEHPITQKYLDDSLLKSFSADETKKLIEAGANVHARGKYGKTPLMRAHSAEQIKILVAAGADIHAKDKNGKTALMHAGIAENIKQLIGLGADVNARDNFNNTPLMFAMYAENTKILIDAGADVNACNKNGDTALMEAYTLEQTKLLIESGADIHACNRFGYNALMLAHPPEQSKYLIEKGLDVNYKNNIGETSLMYARSAEQIQTLLEAGADLHAQDVFGRNALMRAHDEKTTQALLNAGIDINAKDEDGKNALMYAFTAEQTKTLIEAGIDIHAKDKDGKNALSHARTVEQAKILLEAGVELPDTLNKHFTAENIAEIRNFAQDLQQKRSKTMQKNIDRVKNLLNTKQNQGTETLPTAPLLAHRNTSSKIDWNKVSYSRE